MLTQTQLASEIADRLEITTTSVKDVLVTLEEVALDEISAGEKFKICGLVQIQSKIRKARKKRMGRNPMTGEDVQIPAKPADVVVKARVLAKAKKAAPTMAKAKKAGL